MFAFVVILSSVDIRISFTFLILQHICPHPATLFLVVGIRNIEKDVEEITDIITHDSKNTRESLGWVSSSSYFNISIYRKVKNKIIARAWRNC